MAGTRGRGGKTANSSRSAGAAPQPPSDQPVAASSRTTRSTRSSTSRTSSSTKSLKRSAPEDTTLTPKAPKNPKKIVDSVDNSHFSHAYHPFNSSTVHPTSRLANYSVPTSQHHVHNDRAGFQLLAPSPSHWAYPPSWPPANYTPPPPPPAATPSVQPLRTLPPPYRLPPHGKVPMPVIDNDDISDGEESEVEIVEVGDGEADESAAIQFDPPRNVLQDHWDKRTYVPRLAPLPRPIEAPRPRPTPTHRLPGSTPVPVQPNVIQAVSPPIIPTSIVPPAVTAPLVSQVPSKLPDVPTGDAPPLWGWYPAVWQRFVEFASIHILHDMLFAHPFPSGPEGQKWAREATAAAFITFNNDEDDLLDRESFGIHKANISNLALKAARGHRGKFRDEIIDIIFFFDDLGIHPKVPAMIIADRVESLSVNNRFLHAPYKGVDPPPSAMYKSKVLKKAIEVLYMSQPWRKAVMLPWFKDDHREPILNSASTPDSRPPIAFIAFAATAYQNALACLSTGTQDTVPFNNVGYRNAYEVLYELIEADCAHPIHGEIVRANIRDLMSRVFMTNVGLRYGLTV